MGNKNERIREDFIVQYNNSNVNEITNISSFDKRRVVFISLTGLYNTYSKCPSVVLYSALCLLPLKRNWIYQPKKYMRQIKEKTEVFRLFHQDPKKTKTFLNLLKWKDSQGLVFFMLDDIDEEVYNNCADLKSAFWHALSAKLTTLYDPVTGCHYEPIIFDNQFWRGKSEKQSGNSPKYKTKTHLVLAELYLLSGKYKSIQEIIYQSNPNSLNPIILYEYGKSCAFTKTAPFTKTTINGDDGWVISTDY